MNSVRYLIDRSNPCVIRRIDRETRCYWVWLRGGGYDWWGQRWMKQPTDLVFDTFEEAKAELVKRLHGRLRQAMLLEQCGVYVQSEEWVR